MTNREMVIVGLAGLAVLYAVYSTVSEPAVRDVADAGISPATVSMLDDVLKEGADNEKAVAQIFANAGSSWPNDIFVSGDSVPDRDSTRGNAAGGDDVDKVSYQGYLEMAGEKIAIVNNSEYRLGDKVEDFVVVDIDPSRIRLIRDGQQYEVRFRETK